MTILQVYPLPSLLWQQTFSVNHYSHHCNCRRHHLSAHSWLLINIFNVLIFNTGIIEVIGGSLSETHPPHPLPPPTQVPQVTSTAATIPVPQNVPSVAEAVGEVETEEKANEKEESLGEMMKRKTMIVIINCECVHTINKLLMFFVGKCIFPAINFWM